MSIWAKAQMMLLFLVISEIAMFTKYGTLVAEHEKSKEKEL